MVRRPPISTLFPTRRSSDLRADLIRAAARRHFAEHGYDAASMRDIAADAGITIATLYFRCATKEQLLFEDRKSTRLNSSHVSISYAVFCLKKKNTLKVR